MRSILGGCRGRGTGGVSGTWWSIGTVGARGLPLTRRTAFAGLSTHAGRGVLLAVCAGARLAFFRCRVSDAGVLGEGFVPGGEFRVGWSPGLRGEAEIQVA